jgi:hypothetical protein
MKFTTIYKINKNIFSRFEKMWKFKDDHFLAYLICNVLHTHIVLNDIWRCGAYNKVFGGLSCALLLWIGSDVSKVLLEIPFYTIHQVKCQDPNFGKGPSWALRLKHIPTSDKECKNVSSNFQYSLIKSNLGIGNHECFEILNQG